MVIDFGYIVCPTGWYPILQRIISKIEPWFYSIQQTMPLFYQSVSFYEVQYGIVAPVVLCLPLYFFGYKVGLLVQGHFIQDATSVSQKLCKILDSGAI